MVYVSKKSNMIISHAQFRQIPNFEFHCNIFYYKVLSTHENIFPPLILATWGSMYGTAAYQLSSTSLVLLFYRLFLHYFGVFSEITNVTLHKSLHTYTNHSSTLCLFTHFLPLRLFAAHLFFISTSTTNCQRFSHTVALLFF